MRCNIVWPVILTGALSGCTAVELRYPLGCDSGELTQSQREDCTGEERDKAESVIEHHFASLGNELDSDRTDVLLRQSREALIKYADDLCSALSLSDTAQSNRCERDVLLRRIPAPVNEAE